MEVSFDTLLNSFFDMCVLQNAVSYALQKHEGGVNLHLDDVACTGSEIKLVDCMYPGVGLQNCRSGINAAGVICTGEHQYE